MHDIKHDKIIFNVWQEKSHNRGNRNLDLGESLYLFGHRYPGRKMAVIWGKIKVCGVVIIIEK